MHGWFWQVCKAQTLAQCGGPYAHAASLLISEVLQNNPNHEGALLEYVLIVLQRGLAADATRILLRLLVNNHGSARVRCGNAAAHLYCYN